MLQFCSCLTKILIGAPELHQFLVPNIKHMHRRKGKRQPNNDFTECNVPPNWIDDFYFLGPLCWPSLLLGIYCKWENWVVFTRIKTDVAFATKLEPKIQQTKMLVTCQGFGDLFLFGLVWQCSSVQTKYSKGRFKVMATYLQQ